MLKIEELKSAISLSDLAKLLGYTPKSLAFIIYNIPNEKKYSQFQIPKKNGGHRDIMAPTEKLKKLQTRLANLLSVCYEEICSQNRRKKSLSHGFRKNHSIITNAKNHRNKRYVFNFDLKDFFPSLNFGRVRGFFIKNKNFKLNPKVATIIAQIACYNNELPQGSPCSPIISNFIGHILDIRMVNLAKKEGCTYSRYADDLTFSTNKKEFPFGIATKLEDNKWIESDHLRTKIERLSFSINERKTSMQYKTSRQITTGLVVNEKVNVKREYYKMARAYCHSLFKNNEYYINSFNEQGNEFDNKFHITKKGTINQLNGILNFIYHIKRPYDKAVSEDRRREPNSITKLFRQFIIYRFFYQNEKPLIICEGKTDIIYLKCALKRYYDKYPELITKTADKYIYNTKYLRFTKNFKDIFEIPEGSSALGYLMDDYKKYYEGFNKVVGNFPVIIILDTDDGSKKIKSRIKANDFTQVFYKFYENMYIIFISETKNQEIEDLFDEEIRQIKIEDKTFNPKKGHEAELEYGKHIFAEHVIKPRQAEINFERFLPIFDKINAVLNDYHS